MTDDHEIPPPSGRPRRITATAWIALAVVVAVIFVGVMAISHRGGVTAVAPGQSKITTLHNS